MKRLALIVLSLAAVMGGLFGPAPASAVEPNPVEWELWQSAPCVTGEMTARSHPGRLVWVTGWVEPCPGTTAPGTARFAIVYFSANAGTAGRPLHYVDPAGRTAFEGELYTKRPDSLPRAACLAYAPSGLLSCVSLDPGTAPDLLAVAPIPTDDPRVSVPVSPYLRAVGTTQPYCGTCL